ncbi:MAG TPA: hypothetical protein VK794_12860 [Steroidobacteraceae bacterium]|jgi:hypothetical protein|nr:hypothetical protein [Steroidobacteraceae bacterium]
MRGRIGRWKWIFGLIAAAILGLGFWIGGRTSAPTLKPQVAAILPPTAKWPANIATLKVEAPKKTDHSGEIEVCGVGKVTIDRDDWMATSKLFDTLTRKSRVRWLSALRNSDDYRTRATGLYLEGILDRDAPQKDPETARDELVQLAVETKDPAVFALAFTKCGKGLDDSASPGACPQLSLDQWTRTDPDNAVPWLQLAALAHRQHDGATEAAAMGRAAQAHQYETYNGSLFVFAEPAMPNDVTPADRWYLATEIIGVEAAMPMPYQPLSQYCSQDAMNDAGVRGQCNALGELLVAKATTLLDLSAGKSLGKRAGWPAERVDKLTQQLNASMQVLNQAVPSDEDQQWSCDGVARGNAFMSERVRLGEMGFAREAIERSGETVAELSRKHLDFIEKLTQDAQQRMQDENAARLP